MSLGFHSLVIISDSAAKLNEKRDVGVSVQDQAISVVLKPSFQND